jgi:hypothetical protein
MIGFIDICLQLRQLTISDCLRLAPFFTRLRASSLLRDWLGSDLPILHFFSFRCPLVNTPQLNTQLLNSLTTELRLPYQCPMIELSWTELSSRRTEYVTMPYSSSVILFVSIATGTCSPKRSPAMDYFAAFRCSWNMLTEPLPSNSHIRHNTQI